MLNIIQHAGNPLELYEAGGISICCDGREDLTALDRRIYELITA